MNKKLAPDKYVSNGTLISRSTSHFQMWIIENLATGKFHSINTGDETIITMYPPDNL